MCLNCLLPFLTAFGLGALGALGGLGILFRRLFGARAPLAVRPAIATGGRTDAGTGTLVETSPGSRREEGCGCERFGGAR
jgi:hypothetical protein